MNPLLFLTSQENRLEFIKLLVAHKVPDLLESSYDIWPFANVVGNGHNEAIRLLLSCPSLNPTAQDNRLFSTAVSSGRFDTVKLLLEQPSVAAIAD